MLPLPAQQRGGAGATARVHTRVPSQASCSAADAAQAGQSIDAHNDESSKSSTRQRRHSHGRKSSTTTTASEDSSFWDGGEGRAAPSRDVKMILGPVGLPPRPAQHLVDRGSLQLQSDKITAVSAKGGPRQQGFDAPVASLVYPQGKSVDYNPWLGNQPEDNFSEQTVKLGFQNKPSITNESNTARPLLWAHLKNKPGLTTLSNLFVAVLEKRQSSGRLVAPSTFKPPPRLSLTNTKREAWLSDLANPACALRRFNRTIPYGINGKGLLEQCLAKEIPTARAVWLTKCVGANELRVLRRKGVSGALGVSAELKWIREWTMHVEQFIEVTIAACGDTSWKGKIHYVMRLTYHLYVEQLLDTDHFLDWLLLSLESTSSERLPLWLVHVQLYWRYLVCSRRRGRRLAEALCVHLDTLSASPGCTDMSGPLAAKLQVLLSLLASSHRSCLIMPESWSKSEARIQVLSSHKSLGPAITNIVERNNRIVKPVWSQGACASLSPKRQAVQILDEVGYDVAIPDICSKLFAAIPQIRDVVQLVLQWCSSIYRVGMHRTYLASRILRRCAAAGADIEDCVLAFIVNPPNGCLMDMDAITRVVAELTRSKSFAVLRILRAVIARGAMIDSEHEPQAASFRLRCLVQNLPTSGLPQHVEDLQHNLLQNADIYAAQGVTLRHVYQTLERAFAGLDDPEFDPARYGFPSLDNLTLANKFRISAHIRLAVLRYNNARCATSSNSAFEDTGRELSCRVFLFARDVLENLQDIPILADIIGICLRSGDNETLGSALDTIQFHKRSLAAIGALRPLVAEAIERYQTSRGEHALPKPCISSLAKLAEFVQGGTSPLVHQLKNHLARYDQLNIVAMCSPASDNAMDIVATSSLENEAEIERVLSSGTTMDEHSLKRVFSRVSALLLKPNTTVRGSWFSRLRALDETTFDGLLNTWIANLLHRGTLDTALFALPVLLDAEVVSFQDLQLAICKLQKADSKRTRELQVKLSAITMSVFLPGQIPNICQKATRYHKFQTEQRIWSESRQILIIEHLARALQTVDDNDGCSDTNRLSTLLSSRPVGQFILNALITCNAQLQSVARALTMRKSEFKTGFRILQETVKSLLNSGHCQKQVATSEYESLCQLIRMADELSSPVCQLEIQLLLSDHSSPSEPSLETVGLLFEAIMRSADVEHPPWLELVDGLDSSLLQRLRAKAEQQVLKVVNDCFVRLRSQTNQFDHSQVIKVQAVLHKLLCVINSAVKGPSPAPLVLPQPNSESTPTAVDRCGAIREILMRHFSAESGVDAERKTCEMACTLLHALMRILISRKVLMEGHKSGSSEAACVLPALFATFTQTSLGRSRSTAELVYDTAAYLSDDLTDEHRSLLLKSEIPKYPNNACISFILGQASPTDTWLGLATTDQTPPHAVMHGLSTPPTLATARLPPQNQKLQPPVRPPTPGPRLMAGTPQSQQQQQQQQQRNFNPPVAFPLRRWELLQEQGSSITANDTAISLSLVGARKV